MEVARQYDRPDAFLYFDPPYYDAEDCYAAVFPKEDHQRLHDALLECQGYVMVSYNYCPFIVELYKEFYIFHTTRPNSMSQKAGSEYEEIVITNYDPRRHNSARHWQLNLFNLSAADEEEGKYTLIHEPTKRTQTGGMNMTFIKYTSDGKAVIQPAALTLSGLDREETLELHTLENAIVLLKQEMEPAEKAAATTTLLRLAHSLMEDMLADWEAQEDDGDMCDGRHGCDEDMLPIPAEVFADAGILYDNLCVFSVDGAVLVVSDDHKTTWSDALTKAILESGKAND